MTLSSSSLFLFIFHKHQTHIFKEHRYTTKQPAACSSPLVSVVIVATPPSKNTTTSRPFRLSLKNVPWLFSSYVITHIILRCLSLYAGDGSTVDKEKQASDSAAANGFIPCSKLAKYCFTSPPPNDKVDHGDGDNKAALLLDKAKKTFRSALGLVCSGITDIDADIISCPKLQRFFCETIPNIIDNNQQTTKTASVKRSNIVPCEMIPTLQEGCAKSSYYVSNHCESVYKRLMKKCSDRSLSSVTAKGHNVRISNSDVVLIPFIWCLRGAHDESHIESCWIKYGKVLKALDG